MRLRGLTLFLLALALVVPAWGGYQFEGYDLEVIREEHGLTNTALHIGRGGLFTSSLAGVTIEDVVAPDFSFDLPAGSAVRYARLSIGWWGGKAEYTTTLDMTVNGQPAASVDFGGLGDANPVHDPDGVSVYGAGHGMWLTCFDVTDDVQLGQTNDVTLDLPPDTDFDGRCYHWQLVMAYDTPTDYLLSYEIAEGYASLRIYPVVLPDRTVEFSGVQLSPPFESDLWLAYTHGSHDELDYAEINGVPIGSNDVADGSEPSVFFDPLSHAHMSYFDFEHFDVSAHMSNAVNTLHLYTPVSGGERILNLASAVLASRQAAEDRIPEPATMALLGLGLLALARRRRRR